MSGISITELCAEAEALAADLPDGDDLAPLDAALIRLAACVAVTALDRGAIDTAIAAAFDAGASVAQVQEIIALASGLGVHSLMVTATPVLEAAAARDLIDPAAPLDDERQTLWDAHVGDDH